jgi:surfeit locus 1 family protein|tara:strand:- start:367 stop:1077 length:711 start_codon:yes stop_codon:yes gene_type:complete
MTRNKSFNPGIKISVFFIFFAAVFFALGVWQIERGQNKQQVLDAFNAAIKAEPSVLSSTSKKWQRVYVSGSFDESRQILIDNTIFRGRVGFKVFTPFILESSDKLLLVDRGWIEQESFRENLPSITINSSFAELSGLLVNPELGFVLSEDLISKTWPKISQTQSLDYLVKEYPEELYPFILVAEPTFKDALNYMEVIPTNMPPVKHYGYALQWFTMFLVLCGMYIYFGLKNKNYEK